MNAWLRRWGGLALGIALTLAMLLGLLTAGCTLYQPMPGTMLWEWSSDGCSSSPDLGEAVVCCDEHDAFFRNGGPMGTWTAAQFRASNRYLAACLTAHEKPELVVRTYYQAVSGPGGRSAWEANRAAALAP